MKVIISGSRTLTDYNSVVQIIESAGWKIDEVVCGMARGVDQIGERWALANNIPVKCFPANWQHHGKAAGVLRNIEMADYADGLIAIWDGYSKGTRHMIRIAKERNLEVLVWNARLYKFIHEYEGR